ncbi:MAG: TetR-like C-terminal domain-containing protein, partial [Myxococcota bacterium]
GREPQNAQDYLVSSGLVYARFGLERPHLFQLMFSEGTTLEGIARERARAQTSEAYDAYEQLVDGLELWVEAGRLPPEHLEHKAFALWSIIHGATSLWMGQRARSRLEPDGLEAMVHKLCFDVLG